MKKNSKGLVHWLRLFGFLKREKSIKEKVCDAACDIHERYKKEAREAASKLRMKHENQVA